MYLFNSINKKRSKIFAAFLILSAFVIFPITMACRSSALLHTELTYGQSAALLVQETAEASELPDIPHYDLKLEVDIESASYSGSAVIDYTNLEDTTLSSIFLRLFPNGGGTYGNGRLEISSLMVNGSSIETSYSLDDSALELLLEKPLDPEGHLIISCDFQGKVPVDFEGGGYGIFNLKDNILVMAGWYPTLAVYDDEGWNIDPISSIGDSVYSDIAYYTVEVIASEGVEFAATGVAVEELEQNAAAGYRYISGPVRDFFIVIGEGFKIKTKKIEGIDINTYYLPGQEQAADLTLDIAKGSINTFNRMFGGYPYKEFDIVDVPMNGSIAVEFPGIIVVGNQVFGNAVYTSHEIAHQWWYNVVGNDVIDDPWIDEALTTYSSIIYYEFNRSSAEYNGVLDYFKSEYENTLSSGDDDSVIEGLDHFEVLGGKHYSSIVYSKGALFYHEMRQEIGDKAFFAALKDYYADKKYGIASNNDILDRFEEYSGRELDGFYQKWLY